VNKKEQNHDDAILIESKETSIAGNSEIKEDAAGH
jgi:hypothetical protein